MENNEKLKIILEDNLLEKFMINYLQLNDTYDRRYLYVNPLKDFCELIIRYDFFKTMNFKFDYLKDFLCFKNLDKINKDYIEACKNNQKEMKVLLSETIFFNAEVSEPFFISLNNFLNILPGYLQNVNLIVCEEQFNFYSKSLNDSLVCFDVFIDMMDLEVWNYEWNEYTSLEARNWIIKELFESFNEQDKLKEYSSLKMLDLLDLKLKNDHFNERIMFIFKFMLMNSNKTNRVIEKIKING